MGKIDRAIEKVVLHNKYAKVKFKKGDKVTVIAGDDKGKKSIILSVVKASSKIMVVLDGVNLKAKVVTDSSGAKSFEKKPFPIDISNIKKAD
jgi:large subunit ribosomal protein L24